MLLALLLQPFYRLISSSNDNTGSSDVEKSAAALGEPDPQPGTSYDMQERRKPTAADTTPFGSLGDTNELATTSHKNDASYGIRRNDLREDSTNDANDSSEIVLAPDQTSSTETTTKGFRALPLISSIFVPFSILLAIPGVTEHWYIRTDGQHQIVEFQENSLSLRIVLGISLACALLTNLCLLVRLVERMVKGMTITCIIALSIHDILSIIVIVIFIIKTQTDDGFSLGQAFWTTVCSTITSLVTNITLIMDYFTTPNFEAAGSGLTKKQRSLTIIIIILLCYVALGAVVNTVLLNLSFIDALYFSIVCIETIGFGDIDPQTPGSRAFAAIYTTFGILILAIAIGLIRDSMLEAIQMNLYARIRKERKRRIMRRWLGAIKWRLANAGLPIWVPIEDGSEIEEEQWPREMEIGNRTWSRFWWKFSDLAKRYTRVGRNSDEMTAMELKRYGGKGRKRLNLRALTEAQLQAAAMEAGTPLHEILHRHPAHNDHHDHPTYELEGGPSHEKPTHHRMGRMINVLGGFAVAVGVGQDMPRTTDGMEYQQQSYESQPGDTETNVLLDFEKEERKMFAARLSFALLLFLTFWLVGSAIFTVTEKWDYGLALYFCFITFTTVGYGDPVPRTPAGRSFFVGWALLGVGTMTILISFLADRYSERYKNMINAAESTVAADDGVPLTGAQSLNTTAPPPPPLPSSCVGPSGRGAATEEKEGIASEKTISHHIDTLKALVVDEGAHGRGTLHSLERELESMLTLIRRSRRTESQGIVEDG